MFYEECSPFLAEIGELEATRMQHESTIRDLNSKLSTMQDRIKMLEGSKRALESQVGESEFQSSSQIKALEKVQGIFH